MTSRKKKISKKKKVADKKLFFLIGIVTVVVLGLLFYRVFSQTPIRFSLKAGIIDQLGKDIPNLQFNNTVAGNLTKEGFNVSYYKSENAKVFFYNELAKLDYGIIILRAHSALREDETTVDLFTSEEYKEYSYKDYQRNGFLVRGQYLWEPNKLYFAVTSKFIENLDGFFPKSIVFAMGCWSLKPGLEAMAEAFIKKGAFAYIGWTDMVYPQDTDNETAHLLSMLLNEDYSLGEAISQTRSYICSFGNETVATHLAFYPESARNLKISALVREVKPSTTLGVIDNFAPLLQLSFVMKVADSKVEDFGNPRQG
jgi:hypothetical protein